MSKPEILDALAKFAAQRPRLEPQNYISGWRDKEGRANYRKEARQITKDLHHARALAGYVSRHDGITADDIIEASKRAYGGRLEIEQNAEGYNIHYCTGQYFPTEYRRAVAGVLANAIWHRLVQDHDTADDIRRAARHELGAPLTRAFFGG